MKHRKITFIPGTLGRFIRKYQIIFDYLEVPPEEVLAAGEWVGFGISHPCTAVDKWNVLLLVDDGERIVAQLPTFF